MAPDEARTVYRAINDLRMLMEAKLDAVNDKLNDLRERDGDVEDLKTQALAAGYTLQQHEHRIIALETGVVRRADDRVAWHRHWQAIAAGLGGATLGGLVGGVLPHLF